MKRLLASYYLLFILFLFLFVPSSAVAQVLLHEVSPASSPEWVELYNASQDTLSLKGYIIDFGGTNQSKEFCENTAIAGHSYRMITLTATRLSNDGDSVTLKKDGVILDTVSYGSGSYDIPSATQSLARTADGTSWEISDSPSAEGESISFDCPTPTPTATNTPTPQNTPTPTKTPSPTPTIKPSVTPSPFPTSSRNITYPTSKPNVGKLSTSKIVPTAVLGSSTKEETEVSSTPNPSPTPDEKKDTNSQPLVQKIFLGVMAGLAIITVGLGAYLYKKGRDHL